MLQKLKQKTYNILRKSEKYTKTDMVYLTKGGFWLTLGQIFASASAFLLAIAYANFLSKEAYGIYKYVLSIAGIFSAFTLTGMGTAVAQSVARGFEGTLKFAFWKSLKWSIFMMVASLLGAIYYFINENQTLAISLLIIGSSSPLLQSAGLYTSFLNGKKEFKAITLYGMFRSLIPAISIFITITLTNNPIILILVYFVSHTLTTIFLYFRSIKKFQINKEIDDQALNYSKHLSLMNVLSAIANQIDKILIFHYLGAAQLAIYAFAVTIPEQIKGLFKNVGTLAFPKFVNKSKKEIKKSLAKKTMQFGLIMIGIIFVYILVAPFIYKILFPQYLESIFYSQIFAISLLAVISVLPISALQAKSEKTKLYKLKISNSIFQILILFILIYFYGLMGVILARVIARFFNLALSTMLIK
jgi:O-antigen/teichoic acid export membrane protein